MAQFLFLQCTATRAPHVPPSPPLPPGKTLLARAVANRTEATFIRVIGSELVQKYVGEGARMVRELFTMARSKKACIIFFDEVDAIGGARGDDGAGGEWGDLRKVAGHGDSL